MKIITEPNSILHKKCRRVAKFDNKLKTFANKMVETLYKKKGVGLSAPQVGRDIRLIVMEYSAERFTAEDKKKKNIDILKIPLLILINPKITNFSRQMEVAEEGCLSLPNVEVKVSRSIKINCLAYDIEGKRLKIRAKGFLARILQHEIDHTNGILITDKSRQIKQK